MRSRRESRQPQSWGAVPRSQSGASSKHMPSSVSDSAQSAVTEWPTSALAGRLGTSSPYFVPGLHHVVLIELRQALQIVPGLPHVVAHSCRYPVLAKSHWGRVGDGLCHVKSTRSGSAPVAYRNWHPGPSLHENHADILARPAQKPFFSRLALCGAHS